MAFLAAGLRLILWGLEPLPLRIFSASNTAFLRLFSKGISQDLVFRKSTNAGKYEEPIYFAQFVKIMFFLYLEAIILIRLVSSLEKKNFYLAYFF